jgi:mitochondrial cardiolipin hydrolase
MNPDDLARFLRQSLADRRLSGSEKAALAEWAERHIPNDHARGLAGHTAFEVARTSIADPGSSGVVEWLEDVMKVLVPNVTAAPPEPDDSGAEKERACFSPGEQCLLQIVHRFDVCRHTADVCVFTITDDRISRAILHAHQRGVKVRIISDNDKWHDLGSDVMRFREVGIAVKLDNIHDHGDPRRNGHMHHKFAIFDGARLLNGSYNWTRGAANTNFENLVDTGDPELIAAFMEEFKRLWNRF